MKLGSCTIARCVRPATWNVTTDGHPNAPGAQALAYCTGHLFAPTWEDSPTPYSITITGPHKGNAE